MQHAALGGSGLVVSRLSFGAMTLGNRTGIIAGPATQERADALVGQALDLGINFFDTADVYHSGQSEELLGRALGRRRGEVAIMTKVGMRTSGTALDGGLSSRHIHRAVDRSLERLGTDWIDVYVCHRPDPLVPLEETLEALDQLVRSGKVRYLGFSNWPAWLVATAAQLQRQHGWARFVTGQMHYSLVNRDLENEYVPMTAHYGIGTTVWSPLAGGFLTGKYRADRRADGGRLSRYDFVPAIPDSGDQIVGVLKDVARDHATTPAAVALAWLMARPFVSSVIVGFSSEEQFEQNVRAADLSLDDAALKALDEVSAPYQPYPQSWIPVYGRDAVFDSVDPWPRHC